MDVVGLKELKANLGRYVGQAKDGKRIIITDRGKEVAELAPLSPEIRGLLRLCAEGKIRWVGGKPEGLRGVTIKGKPISDTVLEDRG